MGNIDVLLVFQCNYVYLVPFGRHCHLLLTFKEVTRPQSRLNRG